MDRSFKEEKNKAPFCLIVVVCLFICYFYYGDYLLNSYICLGVVICCCCLLLFVVFTVEIICFNYIISLVGYKGQPRPPVLQTTHAPPTGTVPEHEGEETINVTTLLDITSTSGQGGGGEITSTETTPDEQK